MNCNWSSRKVWVTGHIFAQSFYRAVMYLRPEIINDWQPADGHSQGGDLFRRIQSLVSAAPSWPWSQQEASSFVCFCWWLFHPPLPKVGGKKNSPEDQLYFYICLYTSYSRAGSTFKFFRVNRYGRLHTHFVVQGPACGCVHHNNHNKPFSNKNHHPVKGYYCY